MNAEISPGPVARPSLFRRFFSWKTLRRLLMTFAALVTLLALVWGFEDWRGKRTWLAYKNAAEGRGEQLYLSGFIPATVPASENFAMTPFLAPLLEYSYVNGEVRWKDPAGKARTEQVTLFHQGGDYPAMGSVDNSRLTDLSAWRAYLVSNETSKAQTDAEAILAELRKFDPVLAELREAARRPHSVFPIHYDEVAQALLPYLSTLKSVTLVSRLRAAVLLQANRPAEALEEVRLIIKLADAFKQDPLIISKLVRLSILRQATDVVWEGTERHVWADDQLRELGTLLSSVDVIAEYPRMVRGERAFANDFIRSVMSPVRPELGTVPWEGEALAAAYRRLPSGWLYQNQVRINRLYDERVLPLVDVERRQVLAANRDTDDLPELKKNSPYTMLARMLFPAVNKAATQVGRSQTLVDLATVSCALERFHLAKGHYPERLDELVPNLLRKIPSDVMDGAPLRYRNEGTNSFVVYSVGGNRTDDHGEVRFRGKSETQIDISSGDWAWRIGVASAK
jgi:hypothetical protein